MRARPAKFRDLAILSKHDRAINLNYWNEDEYASSYFASSHKIYVLELDRDTIIGAIVFSTVDDIVDILQLWVCKPFQGKGYAQFLLNTMLKDLKLTTSTERIFLEVRQDNKRALCLYQHFGFIIVGERKNYYKADGMCYDAFTMMLDMTNIAGLKN